VQAMYQASLGQGFGAGADRGMSLSRARPPFFARRRLAL
jgi:hypothetical protein